MQLLRIISAGDTGRFFSLALDFVLPYEKRCCSLMQRILQQDDSVHLIVESGTEKSRHPEVYGAFTWSEKGRLIFSCLPLQNEQIQEILSDYFSTRSVFCISGDTIFSDFVYRIIHVLYPGRQVEEHDYFSMEFKADKYTALPAGCSVFQCSVHDADGLMPLQLDYSRVEVLPAWRKVIPSAERLSLERTLKHQFVAGIKVIKEKREIIVAKANTNAISINYVQIGGVYTLPEFRGNGFACTLVNRISMWALYQKKKAVLFVKEKNGPAIKAYTKAGFAVTGHYKIIYFVED